MDSQVGNAYLRENPPPGSLGVATIIKVASDSRTAASQLCEAFRLARPSWINSARPGSCTGARPLLMASTLTASRSTACTWNPRAAKHAAMGEPNLPKPMTETDFTMRLPRVIERGEQV